MKKFIVIIGNFGSGKTELSLNLAFEYAKNQKVTLVDLDIINPYFRSTERKAELDAAGIRLLSPTYAMLGVEIPSLPADIYSVFSDSSDIVIFDVGGDPAGAIALGQYKRFFDQAKDVKVLYVINARRPFSCELDMNLDMIARIREAGRMDIDAIVNNTNLSQETSLEELIDGYNLVRDVAVETGLPVKYTVGVPSILDEFRRYAEDNGLLNDYIGEYHPIERYMHRDWERYTEKGL
ncbi:MAG: hypothetical protein J1E60_03610 [Christensenellaceae bacterium]|nr:hypothetical protein [Christensenellaceae bacterium]